MSLPLVTSLILHIWRQQCKDRAVGSLFSLNYTASTSGATICNMEQLQMLVEVPSIRMYPAHTPTPARQSFKRHTFPNRPNVVTLQIRPAGSLVPIGRPNTTNGTCHCCNVDTQKHRSWATKRMPSCIHLVHQELFRQNYSNRKSGNIKSNRTVGLNQHCMVLPPCIDYLSTHQQDTQACTCSLMIIKTIMMSIAMIIITINIMPFLFLFIWSRHVQSFFNFCNKLIQIINTFINLSKWQNEWRLTATSSLFLELLCISTKNRYVQTTSLTWIRNRKHNRRGLNIRKEQVGGCVSSLVISLLPSNILPPCLFGYCSDRCVDLKSCTVRCIPPVPPPTMLPATRPKELPIAAPSGMESLKCRTHEAHFELRYKMLPVEVHRSTECLFMHFIFSLLVHRQPLRQNNIIIQKGTTIQLLSITSNYMHQSSPISPILLIVTPCYSNPCCCRD